jgi:RNA polymerase sigma-70 factor (sigma-E family)
VEVNGVNQRHQAEFRDFVTGRGPALLRLARALTRSGHDAEDLLQAAFEKTYPKWGRLQDPDAYVRRAICNMHTSWWRRALRRPEELVAVTPDRPAAHDEDGGLPSALARAIGELPPKQRAIVVLRYLDDRTEREVADLLGCSTSTVGSQLNRGLAKLRANYPALAAAEEVRA